MSERDYSADIKSITFGRGDDDRVKIAGETLPFRNGRIVQLQVFQDSIYLSIKRDHPTEIREARRPMTFGERVRAWLAR